MFTVLALVCLTGDPSKCQTIKSSDFLPTEDACMERIVMAVDIVSSNGAFVRDYKCVFWGEPT